jgi:hypothetical protein
MLSFISFLYKKKVANSGSEILQYATISPLYFKAAILLIFSLFAK